MKRLPLLTLILMLVALDLTTKAWARNALEPGTSVEVFPFLDLTLSFNRGVAFGVFNSLGGMFVVLITAVITAGFSVWFWREPRAITRLALAFVIGGASANLADRLQRGAVTDFLDLHLFGLHWPAFNFADTAITCGVVLLLTDMLRTRKEIGSV